MKLRLLPFIFTALVLFKTAADGNPAPEPPAAALAVTLITTPAGAGAMGASLTWSGTGAVYLSWLEPRPNDETALRFARYDAARAGWSPAGTIAQGRDWFVNWADTPSLAVQENGAMTAVWFVNNPAPALSAAGHSHHDSSYQAWFSQSAAEGAAWGAPAPLTRESESVEFVTLQPLSDGRLLAVWLDGRGKPANGEVMQLYGRIMGADGPDQLIDDSVCDCCQTSLTAFSDGSALVAYRSRRAREVRDISTAAFRGDRWERPQALSHDGWKIAGCPVNGPQLDSVGGRVAAVWFTGAGGISRVLTALSTDGGANFLPPQTLDLGNPVGRVDAVMLRNGSRLVTWLEAAGKADAGIYLRLISEAGEIGPPLLLAPTSHARASGFPRAVLLKDFDATPAQLLLAFTQEGRPTAVQTLLLTLPARSQKPPQ